MKKYIKIILGAILAIGISISCEKSDTPNIYEASIKDKTWWGSLNYINQDIEYYSVHFNADHSLLWSQHSGDFSGKWTINENRLTISFPMLATEIKADISEDNKLMNISDDNAFVTINTGELSESAIMPLINTNWSGTLAEGSLEKIYRLNFFSDSEVRIRNGIEEYTFSYSISPYGVIRNATPGIAFFGIVISASAMYGGYSGFKYPWQVTRK